MHLVTTPALRMAEQAVRHRHHRHHFRHLRPRLRHDVVVLRERVHLRVIVPTDYVVRRQIVMLHVYDRKFFIV
jgi:hypothetical protein